MSLSDLHIHSSPHHRLRSSSSNYRLSSDHEGFSTTPDLSSANWNQWTHHGMSPEAAYGSQSFSNDPFDEMMGENASVDEFGCMPSATVPEQQQYQQGLGLDMEVDLGGIEEEEPFGAPPDDVGSLGGRARTRLQSRSTKSINTHSSQPYPTSSSPSSPARSRSGSFRVQIPSSLSLASGQSSPGSSFFPGGLPSPFRQPSTPSSATMDPAHSVRSSSPSSTSSVSGVAMSRVGSSSAASSVYGGEAGAAATPYRGTAPSSGRAKHQSHSRRPSSPTKGVRSAKKLTDLDRKNICLFARANPATKQDDIGGRFGVERSTVSKILKLKDKWLAIPSEDDEDEEEVTPAYSGPHIPSASSTSNDFVSPNTTPGPSASTPHQSPPPPTPVASATATMNSSYAGASDPPHISGGRYPQIDNELNRWARGQVVFARLEDETLQAKARELAQSIDGCQGFKASHTWLDGFKHRAGISEGTFLDLLSPDSRAKVSAEAEAAVQREDVEEDIVVDDQADGDFEERSTRGQRSTKRQQALSARRESSRPSTAVPSSASKMDIDSRTPLRPAFGDQENDATPTHSTVHSRATSAAADQRLSEQRMFDAMYRYSPTQRPEEQPQQQATVTRSSTFSLGSGQQSVHSTPSRHSSTQASPNPMTMSQYSPTEGPSQGYPNYTFSDANLPSAYSTNDLTSYPLQSPFQTSSSQSSFSHYAPAPAGSGQNSPAPSYQHGRSGSTASTTSSYSGLTAFSSQNGTGTPLTGSLYGSFPNSQSNSNSVPSTPSGGTGYFGHGPDGTQSQLQAAFLTGQQQPTSPYPSYAPSQPARRATISGGVPFGGVSAKLAAPASRSQAQPAQSQIPHSQASSPQKATVSLEQARQSLETALTYLKSAEAQGFAGPQDLLVIWELKEKMAAAHKQQQQPGASSIAPSPSLSTSNPFAQPGGSFSFPTKQRRMKLGRTQSASSIAGLGGGLYGMGSRRNNSSVSLFDSSMLVEEASR